jgi:hypothetical protein
LRSMTCHPLLYSSVIDSPFLRLTTRASSPCAASTGRCSTCSSAERARGRARRRIFPPREGFLWQSPLFDGDCH